jgi:hypothetical protein
MYLKETFNAAGRVFGAGAVVAVRQEEGESRLAPPLVLTAVHELVDDDLTTMIRQSEKTNSRETKKKRGECEYLCSVVEITELGLPQHERPRVFHAVSVLCAV